MLKTYSLLLNIKANSHKALSGTVLPHREAGPGIKTGNLQVLCFPFIPLADRWRSTNWRPAPDTTFWNHRKQVPAQAAACVQHPLPVPGSRPPTNVWCKYYLCLQFPSLGEFCELQGGIFLWDRGILVSDARVYSGWNPLGGGRIHLFVLVWGLCFCQLVML